MGYYNDLPPNHRRQKKSGWLIPILLGVIIGILLTTLVVPAVMDKNQATNQQDDDSASITKKDDTGVGHTVNVDISTKVTDVVEEVSPAVVGVSNLRMQSNFWDQSSEEEQGTGSGVIYKQDDKYAYVVTNYHVIEGADEVEVVLFDDTHLKARLLGGDLFSDLAVLRLNAGDIEKTIEMGTSSKLKVGEPVIAIGNPLGHMFAGSVTQGIISGTQRTIPQDFNGDGRPDWQAEVIQTDAAINPGNSGGALINMEGQLIGINSMKINETAVEGIGFSIPIDSARPVIEELEKSGKVTRAYLGVEIYSLDDVPQTEWTNTLKLPNNVKGGVYIWSVETMSPADQAGLQRLDVITALDGKEIIDTVELRKVLFQDKKVGDNVDVTFYREGKKNTITIKLGEQK
ncbi:PDZ domain-containing protein [Ornithinibacillus gellani]|uniref:S1C family serine protease n=1 Tax=Ornithinibacillus gellani TaxID=2293253 RepID=UPI000F48A20D|nr:trypsin-like peptidase domain-containing protein [Ornithinibacillus gellani]TQS76314.1 PDZ domain-containing protein [Ornithinibacillus gellani]